MKMFLTSYLAGTENQLKDFLKDYDSKILFIPTAGNVEEYTGYIDEGIKTLEKLVFSVDTLDIAQEIEEDYDLAITSYDCLCISGGNTFYLLQELKNSFNKGYPKECCILGNLLELLLLQRTLNIAR